MKLLDFELFEDYSTSDIFLKQIEIEIEDAVKQINSAGVKHAILRKINELCREWLTEAGFTRPREYLIEISEPSPKNARKVLNLYYQVNVMNSWPEGSQSAGNARWRNLQKVYATRGGARPMLLQFMPEVYTPVSSMKNFEGAIDWHISQRTFPVFPPTHLSRAVQPARLFAGRKMIHHLLAFDKDGCFVCKTYVTADPIAIHPLNPPEKPKNHKAYMFVFRKYPLEGIFYYDDDFGDAAYVHHSSLGRGEMVSCAGHLEFLNGKIIGIANTSGHYQPHAEDFYGILNYLAKNKQDLSVIIVFFLKLSRTQIFTEEFFAQWSIDTQHSALTQGQSFYAAPADKVLEFITQQKATQKIKPWPPLYLLA